MSKSKDESTFIVLPNDYFSKYFEENCEDIKPPSNLYIVNGLGEFIFVKTRNRAKAQEAVDREYGKGKYKIRTWAISNNRGQVTAK